MKTKTAPGVDFVRDDLRHVLPMGLRAIRDYGFCHPAAKKNRERIKIAFCQREGSKRLIPSRNAPSIAMVFGIKDGLRGQLCERVPLGFHDTDHEMGPSQKHKHQEICLPSTELVQTWVQSKDSCLASTRPFIVRPGLIG